MNFSSIPRSTPDPLFYTVWRKQTVVEAKNVYVYFRRIIFCKATTVCSLSALHRHVWLALPVGGQLQQLCCFLSRRFIFELLHGQVMERIFYFHRLGLRVHYLGVFQKCFLHKLSFTLAPKRSLPKCKESKRNVPLRNMTTNSKP